VGNKEESMRRIASHVRGHFVAYLALFFALGGTSMAAVNALPRNSVGSPQIKNGSIQKIDISKRTVAALHGARGARGPTGAPGATGATGATGAKGDKGDPGTPAPTTLPTGSTESGDYAVGGSATNGYMNQGFQFAIPLAAALNGSHVEFHQKGTTSTNCPGLGQAAAGFLCVYEAEGSNVNYAAGNPINNHSGFLGADATGFFIFLGSTGTFSFSYGSWTVKGA
jgi:hypothetical protein